MLRLTCWRLASMEAWRSGAIKRLRPTALATVLAEHGTAQEIALITGFQVVRILMVTLGAAWACRLFERMVGR